MSFNNLSVNMHPPGITKSSGVSIIMGMVVTTRQKDGNNSMGKQVVNMYVCWFVAASIGVICSFVLYSVVPRTIHARC